MLCIETSAETSLLFGKKIFKKFFRESFLWTGVIFANFKWFEKLEESIMLLKRLRRKGEKISLFSFSILLGVSVSCTDLLKSQLFYSFCKLDKLKLEKEKFRVLHFSLIANIPGCL